MKNLNIENAKKLFFTDKQHYLNFRKAWAEAVNSPKAKNTKEQYGWITSAHMFLFSILAEKNVLKAFTPVTNKNKILNGMNPFGGLVEAHRILKYYLKAAMEYQQYVNNALENKPVSTWQKQKGMSDSETWVYMANNRLKDINQFLAPFDGTVTVEMLIKLFYNDVFYTDTNIFSYTKELEVRKIIQTQPITPQTLWDMYQEAS